jgi:hemerythrin-like metal-binding protein
VPELQWKADFELGLARMDDTHHEFVEHYNALASAAPDDFLARLDDFAAHAEAHFAQENRWMEAVGFPACHRAEHERVLAVIGDIRQRVANGDRFLGRRLVEELPAWFANHTEGMDAALAFHLQSIGFDVERAGFVARENDGCAPQGGCACASLAATPEMGD